jgi:hypothetical protein
MVSLNASFIVSKNIVTSNSSPLYKTSTMQRATRADMSAVIVSMAEETQKGGTY